MGRLQQETMSEADMRANVLAPIRALEIPKDELVVVGGAALQAHGIRLARDIDVVVTPERLEQLLEETDRLPRRKRELGHLGAQLVMRRPDIGRVLADNGEYGITKGDITWMPAPNDKYYRATFAELHDEAVDMGGVLVSPLSRILAWKQALLGKPFRDKDRTDVRLIEQRWQETETPPVRP
ncbi:MAG TPA: hypothetical protein VLF91_02435 [Candidatus Saccharimonadales bacterium]|nr:hypothetical protein [Candidatus Saccharimonadales bacterium]